MLNVYIQTCISCLIKQFEASHKYYLRVLIYSHVDRDPLF